MDGKTWDTPGLSELLYMVYGDTLPLGGWLVLGHPETVRVTMMYGDALLSQGIFYFGEVLSLACAWESPSVLLFIVLTQ